MLVSWRRLGPIARVRRRLSTAGYNGRASKPSSGTASIGGLASVMSGDRRPRRWPAGVKPALGNRVTFADDGLGFPRSPGLGYPMVGSRVVDQNGVIVFSQWTSLRRNLPPFWVAGVRSGRPPGESRRAPRTLDMHMDTKGGTGLVRVLSETSESTRRIVLQRERSA
jgi:hypothetical protein